MLALTLRLLTVPVAAAALAAQGYLTGFETILARRIGAPMSGQDGFFVPPVPGAVDANAWTYAANALGVPANAAGGARFFAATGPGGTASARSQRAVTLPTSGLVTIAFDVCCRFVGTATPTDDIGGFALQPATSRCASLIARWPAGVALPPTSWNADVSVGPGAAGTTVAVPNPAFQGLPVNVWHRWSCTINLTTNEYTELRLVNGATSATVVHTPSPGSMPLPNPGGSVPTEFCLFAGGTVAGNVFAIDNLLILGQGFYTTSGGGCAGTLGVPALALVPGTRPGLGTNMVLRVSNLPVNAAIMVTGLSNTSAFSGSAVLPLDLAAYGMAGCTLLADPLVTVILFGAGNIALWTLPVPNNQSLLGIQFFNQGFSVDPPANPTGLTASNAGTGVVGR